LWRAQQRREWVRGLSACAGVPSRPTELESGRVVQHLSIVGRGRSKAPASLVPSPPIARPVSVAQWRHLPAEPPHTARPGASPGRASPGPAPSTHRRRRWLIRSASPPLRHAPTRRLLPTSEGLTVPVAPPPPAVARRSALPVCGARAIRRVCPPMAAPTGRYLAVAASAGEHVVVSPPAPKTLRPAAVPPPPDVTCKARQLRTSRVAAAVVVATTAVTAQSAQATSASVAAAQLKNGGDCSRGYAGGRRARGGAPSSAHPRSVDSARGGVGFNRGGSTKGGCSVGSG